MGDRILVASFLMTFVIYGFLNVKFPEYMVRTTGINTLKKQPTAKQIKAYKRGGYVIMVISIILVIIALFGGFKGT